MKKALVILGLVLFVAVGVVTATVPFFTWIGGYEGGLFEFEFKDEKGNPVKGVQMEVSNVDGERIDGHVIKDFGNNQQQCDDRGVLSVHARRRKFGGECFYLFCVIPIGECGDNKPIIFCRFVHQGKEVYKTTYDKLSDELVNRGTQAGDNTNRSLRKRIIITP